MVMRCLIRLMSRLSATLYAPVHELGRRAELYENAQCQKYTTISIDSRFLLKKLSPELVIR